MALNPVNFAWKANGTRAVLQWLGLTVVEDE